MLVFRLFWCKIAYENFHSQNKYSGSILTTILELSALGGAQTLTFARSNLQEICKLEIPGTHTLAELQTIAKEQGFVIEEKYGRYRVTSKHSIRDLSITWRVVEAGAGYSLTLKDLHSFFGSL